jgi:hypothetical protein
VTWLLALLTVIWHVLMPAASPPPVSRSAHRTPLIPSAWQRLADCESGGDWSIDTGNGFYGGLQFTASTWTSYKDPTDPRLANLATPWRQVVVARRVAGVLGPRGPTGRIVMAVNGPSPTPEPAELQVRR